MEHSHEIVDIGVVFSTRINTNILETEYIQIIVPLQDQRQLHEILTISFLYCLNLDIFLKESEKQLSANKIVTNKS